MWKGLRRERLLFAGIEMGGKLGCGGLRPWGRQQGVLGL